jgi:allantoin racemase
MRILPAAAGLINLSMSWLEGPGAMKILIVNPNTTDSMTETIAAAARDAASDGTNIIAVTSRFGPASIEGYFDEAFSVPGLIDAMKSADPYDAVIIACFDDTGLDAARCFSSAPVIGIGEAAFHMASLISGQFSVITTLRRSVPAIKHNLTKYGLLSRCSGVRASDIAVLDLEKPGPDVRARISEEIRQAAHEDRAEAIVLGCAGMADYAEVLSHEHGMPVLDGVACAVRLAEALVGLGLKTSKIGGYAPPRGKPYTGLLSGYSPTNPV